MRALAAVALVLLLSGCVQVGKPADRPAPPPQGPLAGVPNLAFLPPVRLACRAEDSVNQVQDTAFGTTCGGFGEPVIEVAGDGAVWASATCCVGRSPPIWVSRDGGRSFHLLPFADRTGVVRDAFGIEGDFAMDDAGNVFFFDIAAASTYFTKYRADGTHVQTKPDAFPPLVDRPWVRAGKADEAWVFYNTGSATNLYHSTDGGVTWTLLPTGFNCGLMVFGQGPARDRLLVAGCPGEPKLWVSVDGGASFAKPVRLPVPQAIPPGQFRNGTSVDVFMPPVADAAGNVYVPMTYATDRDGHTQGIFVDVVRADGSVAGPFQVSAPGTWNEKPWGAAGAAGRFVLAWYGTNQTRAHANDAVWDLVVAATLDGASAAPAFQTVRPDPEPVLKGDFGRQLGDFLQSDVGPDGRAYVIYSHRGADGVLDNRVAVSDGPLGFGPGIPANGPKA
jgi:hypothetical protein